MPKPFDPLKVLNTMAGAAHQKSQPKPSDEDEDDLPAQKPAALGKKSPKQVAALNEKKKGKM